LNGLAHLNAPERQALVIGVLNMLAHERAIALKNNGVQRPVKPTLEHLDFGSPALDCGIGRGEYSFGPQGQQVLLDNHEPGGRYQALPPQMQLGTPCTAQ
jgi:hypothetical protein